MNPQFNRTVLMSGADYFSDSFAINALMDASVPVDVQKAAAEHASIRSALKNAGIQVVKVGPPEGCQDGVYTANWALVRNGTALMARLPNKRKGEEPYARQQLEAQGIKTVTLPNEVERFSGQGDALPCGNLVFTQSPYRTSPDAHPYLKSVLGFEKIIALQTKPSRRFPLGSARKNKITGWPDSPTYDLDLALAILKWQTGDQKGLIAWCPSVFTRQSRRILRQLTEVDKIEVSKAEALQAYALNLVSTGETAIMNAGAPHLQAEIEKHGLRTVTLDLPELKKGGGSIRCTTLTLNN